MVALYLALLPSVLGASLWLEVPIQAIAGQPALSASQHSILGTRGSEGLMGESRVSRGQQVGLRVVQEVGLWDVLMYGSKMAGREVSHLIP